MPPVEQPVVMNHPRTGRKTLFVNRLFTASINGLSPDESDRLLDLLCRQAEVPEYHVPAPLAAGFDRLLGQPGGPALRCQRLLPAAAGHGPGRHRRHGPTRSVAWQRPAGLTICSLGRAATAATSPSPAWCTWCSCGPRWPTPGSSTSTRRRPRPCPASSPCSPPPSSRWCRSTRST